MRPRLRVLLPILAAIALIIVWPAGRGPGVSPAAACSYTPITFARARDAPVIFLGRVVRTKAAGSETLVTFSVERVFSGWVTDEVTGSTSSGASCGLENVGFQTQWLVFAGSDLELRANSGTRRMDDRGAQAWLDALGAGYPPRQHSLATLFDPESGFDASAASRRVFDGTALIVLSLGGIGWLRKRRARAVS
ncbi:MAG: hypothetical protein IPJ34_19530 [Myxococcales bacterium]|nr:hypothetical protein [Myxococcales bacterium]